MNVSANTPVVVSGIIEGPDRQVLIGKVESADGDHIWEFPSGVVNKGETPEAAMRRVASETVGLEIDIQVGQPPFIGHYRGGEATFRYFLVGLISGEAASEHYAELRWIPRGALREYLFDETTQKVVDWFLDA